MHRLFPVLALCLLLFSACAQEKSGKGPWLFGNLYIRYLQDGQQIKAEASFFKGDSSHNAVPVSILGGVSFQGSGMESRNLQNKLIRYQYQNTGEYTGSYVFQAQDEEGRPHRFSMEMPPVSDYSLPDTIYSGMGFTLQINPAPGAQPESLAILFSDQDGKASLVEIPGPVSSSVSVLPGQISRLAPGPYQVYLVKKQRTFVEKDRFKVNCDMEFYTVVKEVAIVSE